MVQMVITMSEESNKETEKKELGVIKIWDENNVPLIFGKYDITEVVVEDPGLKRYINLDPIYVPHTSGRFANKKFGKTKMNIIERLINNLMRTEKYTGKKSKAYKVVKQAFEIIHKRTKRNPIQVLVDAIQNAAPIEETTRLKLGGVAVPKAVDTSSSRRLDIALANICRGTMKSTFKSKRPISECLANEIIKASEGSMESFAVSKRDEMERIAASAR